MRARLADLSIGLKAVGAVCVGVLATTTGMLASLVIGPFVRPVLGDSPAFSFD